MSATLVRVDKESEGIVKEKLKDLFKHKKKPAEVKDFSGIASDNLGEAIEKPIQKSYYDVWAAEISARHERENHPDSKWREKPLAEGERWALIRSGASEEWAGEEGKNVVLLDEKYLDDALFGFVFGTLGFTICKMKGEKIDIV